MTQRKNKAVMMTK